MKHAALNVMHCIACCCLSPLPKVPRNDARCQSLFSGTVTPVLLLVLVGDAPALSERESLVYHWRYWMHLQYNITHLKAVHGGCLYGGHVGL